MSLHRHKSPNTRETGQQLPPKHQRPARPASDNGSSEDDDDGDNADNYLPIHTRTHTHLFGCVVVLVVEVASEGVEHLKVGTGQLVLPLIERPHHLVGLALQKGFRERFKRGSASQTGAMSRWDFRDS